MACDCDFGGFVRCSRFVALMMCLLLGSFILTMCFCFALGLGACFRCFWVLIGGLDWCLSLDFGLRICCTLEWGGSGICVGCGVILKVGCLIMVWCFEVFVLYFFMIGLLGILFVLFCGHRLGFMLNVLVGFVGD